MFGFIERHPEVRLGGEVIDLIRRYLGHQGDQPGAVA
jgi:hypothetical protein